MNKTIKNLLRPGYRLAKKALNALPPAFRAKAVWRANLHTEVGHWDDWFATKGGRRRELYLKKLDPNRELDPLLAKLLPPGVQPVDLLDVGAGPLTVLGKKCKGRTLRIVAIDPLAQAYDKLLSKHGVTPPVRTIRGDAEQLSAQFGRESFDLVYAQNCIDHSYSPEAAILEMVRVVRKDGFVVLKHSANEAEKQRYEGLHQWNLCQEDGDLIISTKTSKLNFTQKHKELCKINRSDLEHDYFLAIIQRNA